MEVVATRGHNGSCKEEMFDFDKLEASCSIFDFDQLEISEREIDMDIDDDGEEECVNELIDSDDEENVPDMADDRLSEKQRSRRKERYLREHCRRMGEVPGDYVHRPETSAVFKKDWVGTVQDIIEMWERMRADTGDWRVPDIDEMSVDAGEETPEVSDIQIVDELSDDDILSEQFQQLHLGPVCETSTMMQGWHGIMSEAMQATWQDAVTRYELMEILNVEKRAELRPLDALGSESRNRGKPMAARKIGGKRYRLSRGVTVDSGAADNVMPKRLLRGGKIRSSEASRAGVHYVACNNGRIPNEGEADLAFKSVEGHEHRWTFQIAEVNKVLASVSALVDTNHRVIFDQDEKTGTDISFIIDKTTGVSTKMRRERNVWVVDAWINDEDDDEQADEGFIRRE